MKHLKNLLIFCLSLHLLLICPLAVFAEGETTAITSETAGGTSISATTVIIPTPNYSVSVPTGIPVGEIVKSEGSSIKSTEFTVGVSEFKNSDGKQIKLTLSTPYDAFQLRSGDHILPYQVYNTQIKEDNQQAIEIDGVFHIFTKAETVTGHIEIDQKDIPAEGEYSGALTFTFHVEDKPAS